MPVMNRRNALKTLGLSVAGSALALPGAESYAAIERKSCNMLVIKSDEHNPRYSSIYGHPFIRTPNLERLARMGTVFENAYCPSPLCMPSRSATMSGLRVHQIQTYSNCNVIPQAYPSYGEMLRRAGVHSVHIGKVDVYRPAEELGFSEMLLPGDRQSPGDTCIERKPLCIREDGHTRADGFGIDRDNPFAGDDRRTETALQWLKNDAKQRDSPWTLELNLSKPHFPHMVTEELWNLYPQGEDLPLYGAECESANHPYARDLRTHFQTDRFDPDRIRGLRRGYLGCVTYIDRQVGKVLDVLESEGLLANTVVAYTTDHGEMLGKFGLWWKCSLYEDSVRVPLVVAGPGFAPGRRIATPVDLLDLQATYFNATGAGRPEEWIGTPLQHLTQEDPERFVFAEYHGHGTRASAYTIRKQNWKLIYYAEAPHQLFDLADDPEERRNIYDAAPDRARELTDCLYSICDPEAENRRAEAYIERQLHMVK